MESTSGRTLIVSNRLPVTVQFENGLPELSESSGGLATGLLGYHGRTDALWLGWPGITARLPERQRADVDRVLAARRIVAVHLSPGEVRQFYEGFSNGVIWPLFHYLLDRIPLGSRDWDVYRAVNEKFASATVQAYRPGDVIWVHDYQLLLAPAFIRARIPDARIGFFLHIPFPSSEVFRIFPWRRELLAGVLGADLIGFHTQAYVRHFLTAAEQVMGLDSEGDQLDHQGRTVAAGSFPMGIDTGHFERLAGDAMVREQVDVIRGEAYGRQIMLGVDRLDYTKGVPRRLLAFGRLLEREPILRRQVRLIQVTVPSRTAVEPYQAFRKQIEELVGRINGATGTFNSVPIHYLYRSLLPQELVALYRAADVMLVTPLRDGMNLVAKEFVAARTDEDGVLVLSEFAGAAAELTEALHVNPYDLDGLAAAMHRALGMSPEERHRRMRALRTRVLKRPVAGWAEAFLTELARVIERTRPPQRTPGIAERLEPAQLLERVTGADRLVILLDYDGTLVPFASTPDLAQPDPQLLELLSGLAGHDGCELHLISGRSRETLGAWFADVPADIWAEHGFWRRRPGQPWEAVTSVDDSWKAPAREILEEYTAATAGSLIEEKTSSLAWHYRAADRGTGAARAAQLADRLRSALGGFPVDILEGSKVLEIRPRGGDKGRAVASILGERPAGLVIAIGDDRTDEDMFAALPAGGLGVHVGHGPTKATHSLADPAAVRAFLQAVLDAGRPGVPAAATVTA